ncbi:MAG: hypothetical protein GXP40_07320 [Chloroflexi bacterium]|nr:hypothetical protein [Chloroflexota bacterium]
MKTKSFLYCTLLMGALLLTACGGGATTEPAPPETPAPVTEAAAPAPPTAVPEPDFDPQPPDPQRFEFKTSDGVDLVGYYYPASVPDAPLIVLMHWAGGDQTDWTNIGMVQWLQNRGGSGGGMPAPVRQTGIFVKPLAEGISFAVFTFDFRGFGESGTGPDNLHEDAIAAVQFAKNLEGIDPARFGIIGSSIGADGAVIGCRELGEACKGALSFSPGNYLGEPYAEAVKAIDEKGIPAWCIAAKGDTLSADTCEGATGEHYMSFIYPGDIHGTRFLEEATAPPDIVPVIFKWLDNAALLTTP